MLRRLVADSKLSPAVAGHGGAPSGAALATLLLAIVLAASAPAASADSFVDSTPGTMAFAVPAGVSSISLSATGGGGGVVTDSTGATLVPGGRGALVTGTVAVHPGEQVQLTVAANGGNASAPTGMGGAPEGGTGGWSAGGGGGATRVMDCQGVFCLIGVVAGGGGGAGADGFFSGGSTGTLPGGAGGAAGAPGTNGSSDAPISGGAGGGPGMAGAVGAGGSGADAGDDGSGPAGGAGGNHSGVFNLHEGGGGGGGGVFGGGGGGSGTSGMDASLNQAETGGGGGGGGSSVAPPGGSVATAASGAAPRIVLTWMPPAGSGSGSGSGASGVPVVGGETLTPSVFAAAPSGRGAVAASERRYGTRVGYTLNRAASVSFTVVEQQPGRRAKGGRCIKGTRAARKAMKCRRRVALAGSFTRASSAGANNFRFTGRLGSRKLKPGKYQLVATPSVGATSGRAVSASFQIVK